MSSDDFMKNLKALYGQAALQREASRKLTSDEWRQYRQTREHFDNQRRFEQRNFEMDHTRRYNAVRQRLIDQAGKTGTIPSLKNKLFGSDPFDKDAINAKAQKIVQANHDRALKALDDQKKAALEAILTQASYRRELRDKPKRDFNKAADRRSGKERRAPKRSR